MIRTPWSRSTLKVRVVRLNMPCRTWIPVGTTATRQSHHLTSFRTRENAAPPNVASPIPKAPRESPAASTPPIAIPRTSRPTVSPLASRPLTCQESGTRTSGTGSADGRCDPRRALLTGFPCPGGVALLEQHLPHLVGLAEREVGERHLRLGRCGLDLELRQPEQAGHEGLVDPDLEDPVQSHPARAAVEHARVDAQLGGGDPELGAVPGGEAEDGPRHQDGGRGDRGAGELTLLDHLPPARVRGCREEDRGAGDRCERGEPPELVLRRGDVVRERVAHRPDFPASPSSVSRSRSRAASCGARPGIRAAVAGDAVCSWTAASPNARSSGPAVTSTSCMRP